MARIANDITELIGRTPLLRLNKIKEGIDADILVKCEFVNPLSSIKDRIGLAMIMDAEKKGRLNKDTVIIEPTSGNTGIALAFVCAQRGYKLILTMPETMSVERRKLLKIFGAEVVLTDGTLGMQGAVDKANELAEETSNSFVPMQFNNYANPEIHRMTTAQEIFHDTDGKVDILISAVGTGGTLSGVSDALKNKIPGFKTYAVEPFDSPVLSGGEPGSHKIQGIGAGFVPEVLDKKLYDDIILVKHDDAGKTARDMAKLEGVLVGISSGANIWAAMEVAKMEENKGKTIVTFACDTGERYLSTWLFEE